MFNFVCTHNLPQLAVNVGAWKIRKQLELKAAMDAHIKRSLDFARANHPWTSQTGDALGGLACSTEMSGAGIVSTLYGKHQHNWYLEDPLNCIHPYGNVNAPIFGSRFRIIEQATTENLVYLMFEITAIMGRP